MGDKTGIQWTEATWNPARGCSRVSPGCENCYAERVAARFSGPGRPYHHLAVMTHSGPRWTREVVLVRETLRLPLRWKRPRRIFVNSMSDLFHESLSNEEIASVFGVMAGCQQHTFQVLTKRAKRMREWFTWADYEASIYAQALGIPREAWALLTVARYANLLCVPETHTWPLPNVWLGVSAEDQQRADERIPALLSTPAAVRFVSYEPAIGPVDFRPFFKWGWKPDSESTATWSPKLHWIIVGGESGPNARPFRTEWGYNVVRACIESHVAVFVKQMGSYCIDSDTNARMETADRHGGNIHEWPIPLQHRQYPDERKDRCRERNIDPHP